VWAGSGPSEPLLVDLLLASASNAGKDRSKPFDFPNAAHLAQINRIERHNRPSPSGVCTVRAKPGRHGMPWQAEDVQEDACSQKLSAISC
jgi:hypothetical protein